MPGRTSIRLGHACLWCLALLAPPELPALDLETQTPFADADPGSVGLGFGLRFGDSPYRGVDDVSSINNENTTDLVPLYLYEGKWLFFHGTSAGIHLLDREGLSLDAVASYRFDRLEPDADPYFAGLEERRQTVDGGLSLSYRQPWGTLTASAVTDLLGRHDGQEFDLTYQLPLTFDRLTLRPYASYVYQTSSLVDYYYGVDAADATPNRPAYHADADGFWRVGLNSSYQLTRGWQLYANLGYERLSDSVRDSPLTDKNHTLSGFVGATYQFGNVFGPRGVSSTTKGTWSWRVNVGYTAEETFLKVHQGALLPSDDVDTYLAGFTLGKLLSDGEKVDFWGRVSLNRRFENGLQDDFFEYVAYVMAMGTGYSPWTDKEMFRYGFGFGFSYADKVPMVEQIKQTRRGRNTSHFLNYMEAQVDFPLQTLFGPSARENCYVGLTLVHRSGIFASADILNNVSGGSDVMTAHLECKH